MLTSSQCVLCGHIPFTGINTAEEYYVTKCEICDISIALCHKCISKSGEDYCKICKREEILWNLGVED